MQQAYFVVFSLDLASLKGGLIEGVNNFLYKPHKSYGTYLMVNLMGTSGKE